MLVAYGTTAVIVGAVVVAQSLSLSADRNALVYWGLSPPTRLHSFPSSRICTIETA